MWERAVLPALTFLRGWIEVKLIDEQDVPEVVAHEQRKALRATTSHVQRTLASHSQTIGGLAPRLWEASVELVEFFLASIQPKLQERREAQAREADARAALMQAELSEENFSLEA